MKKRILSVLLCLCMVCSLLPATALAASSVVSIGGVELGDGTITTYYVNSASSATTGDEPNNWNAKLEKVGSDLILTLKGLSYNGNATGIYSSSDLKIVLDGNNSITTSSDYGIHGTADLKISGTTASEDSLTITGKNNGIFAFNNYMGYQEEIVIENVTITATGTNEVGIVASKSLTIKNSKINSTGAKYGLQGGNFTSGHEASINISNSSITANATGSGGGQMAFKTAPTITGSYQWRSSNSDNWTASSASTPDFSLTYLELQSVHASHPICGASCSHSSGTHTNETWQGISSLTNDMAAGSYYLTGDVTLTDASWTPTNNITLCLNGHTITADGDFDAITVESGKTFTLTDCQTGGKLTHTANKRDNGVNTAGTFIMYGGTISGNEEAGVDISGGEFTMYGGEISENAAGGVVVGGGTFTLDGGKICENTGNIGGVAVSSDPQKNVNATFTMKSGSIEGNTSYMGGGVYAYATTKPEDVTFTMEGGTIRHNTAVMGGGVYVHGATFNMKGGTICENNVTTSQDIGEDVNGGGVYVSDYVDESGDVTRLISPVFNLSGGEITGNVKDGTISGSTLSGGTDNNVYLTAARTINISGALTGTGRIGVTTQTPPDENYAVPITDTNSGDFSGYFTSDNDDYEPFYDGNVVKLRVKETPADNDQAPTLTAGTVSRTGDAEATVKFNSSEAGTYYYKCQHDGAALAPEASQLISTGTNGTCDSGENTLSITLYTAGQHELFIVVKDDVGNESNVLTIEIPAYDAPVSSIYSISADTTILNFGSVQTGYTTPAAQTITIKNNGNQQITLTQPTAANYTIGALSKANLAAGETATFTVQPKSGLAAGTYNETITVQGANGGNSTNVISISAQFAVQQPTPSYDDNDDDYTPSTPATESITVPISGDEKTINVDASVKGNTATVKDVDLSRLDTVIGEEVQTGVVTIDFSGLKKNIDTVEIPAEVVRQIAEAVNDPDNDAQSLEVILSNGTSIEFDDVALSGEAAQAGGRDITISIDHHEDAKLTNAQKNEVGDRPAYDINVTSGGKRISDIGGRITVHIPYELKPGEKGRGIVVWYVDDHGGRERCETSYDEQRKRVSWKTDHLSLYMIDYDEALAEACDGGENCPSAKFIDVDTSLWYHEAIDYAIENGLMGGYGNGYFGPSDNLSRGMLAQILYNLEERPAVSGEIPFTDVAGDRYYYNAILWAQQNGIAGGYGGDLFGPDDPITREQLATILWRYAQVKGYDVSVGESTNILSYEDAFEISEYAIPAMQWACGDGVMQGNNGELNPKGNATRTRVAQMLKNFLENIMK